MIPFITFDTETRGLFGKIFRWRAYDGQSLFSGYSADQAVVYLMGLPEQTHVYIHNLEFDLSKLLKSGILLDLDNSRIINRAFAVAALQTGQVLHCSWHIMRSSLKSLSKSFDLGDRSKMDLEDALVGYEDEKGRTYETFNQKKGKIVGDLEKFFKHCLPDDPLLNQYLDNDVISLHDILTQVIEFSGLEEKFYHIVTTPQLSMNIFKKNFKDDYDRLTKLNHHSDMQEYFFREAYIGAHTEMFIPEMMSSSRDEPAGLHYDVNSLYPYVMENFEYPIGRFNDIEGPEALARWNMILKKHDKYPAAIVACTILVPKKEKYPPLPVRVEGKLIFPTGKVTGVWTLPEINYALSRGAKMLSVSRIVYWKETADYFARFISWAKNGKLTSKGGKRQLYKDMMNSFYGKLGMNLIRENYLADTEANRQTMIPEAGINDYFVENVGNFLEGWTKIKKYSVPYVQPHIAAYVTAYARLELIKAIHREESKGNPTYYCDTDSMVVKYPIDEAFVDDGEFGKWKEENVIAHAIFLEPKLYAEKPFFEDMPETIKGKGIPRHVLDGMDFTFYADALQRIKDGAEEIKIFEGELRRRKIISSWKNGKDTDAPMVDGKIINFRLRQKRDIDWAKNDSKPWDYELFEQEMMAKQEKEEERIFKNERRDAWLAAHNGAPSLWWAIRRIGGIKSSEKQYHPEIPLFMLRKNGWTLDIFPTHSELMMYGFYFETMEQFIDAVKNWKKYVCP